MIYNNNFNSLCSEVTECKLCDRMSSSRRVLSRASGALNAQIMFIGEAPGRLGADDSGIPFHGDKSGHNFESLLDFASIDRSIIFVTNAVLCNPKEENGNNSTPTKSEIINCSNNLKKQIDIINPKVIVTLGATALESLKFIESHDFTLKNSVRNENVWYNRTLITLYHPGQRAMLHRNINEQRLDYQFVADSLGYPNLSTTLLKKDLKDEINKITNYILNIVDSISYFSLHKVFYLIEFEYYKKYGKRLTNAYIVKKEYGPYVTDLHFYKIKNNLPSVKTFNKNGILFFRIEKLLFEENSSKLESSTIDIINKVVDLITSKDHTGLNDEVYRTYPIKSLLLAEKENNMSLQNVPIHF